jgi:N-formylglutamate amidohydrolase
MLLTGDLRAACLVDFSCSMDANSMKGEKARQPNSPKGEAGGIAWTEAARWLALSTLLWVHAGAYAQEKTEPRRLLTVWAGMLPIILSAPHGGREAIPGVAPRRGAGVAQFATERDNNTAELAEKIGVQLERRLSAKPFMVIARFERKYVDANRPRADAYEAADAGVYYDAYHQALRAACEQVRLNWGGGVLLDIHGQGAEADTIFRGTDNGRSVAAMREKFGAEALMGPRSILGRLALMGYRVVPDASGEAVERRYTGGYTTRTYGSHRGTRVDAIQLELGTNLRARRNLDRTAADFAEAITMFAREYLPLGASPHRVAEP